MNMMYWAIIVLGAFVAIWLLIVAPAERRHHERKLAMLQRKINSRDLKQEADRSDSDEEQMGSSRET